MCKSEPGVIRYKNVRKHFRFINLVRLTICSANPQDMSHEIKFVRTFSLSSSMHKWRRMIIWQNFPNIFFGVSKFSPFRVKTKEFLILTLNRFMCISAKKKLASQIYSYLYRGRWKGWAVLWQGILGNQRGRQSATSGEDKAFFSNAGTWKSWGIRSLPSLDLS